MSWLGFRGGMSIPSFAAAARPSGKRVIPILLALPPLKL